MGLSLGSDIGGTFTDFALVDGDTSNVRIQKRLTMPTDPLEAVEHGVASLLYYDAENLDTHIHGTTLVINVVIERKGAHAGLITTEGFRDVIEIGREERYDGWDLKISFPEPLIERALRLEVAERTCRWLYLAAARPQRLAGRGSGACSRGCRIHRGLSASCL